MTVLGVGEVRCTHLAAIVREKEKIMKIQAKLKKLRDRLTQGLVEREEAVKLALLATLSGEHLLLIGPPRVRWHGV